MTSILVDSNIILDLLEPSSPFGVWSFRQLDSLSRTGDLIINQIVYAETAEFFEDGVEFQKIMIGLAVERDDLPWEAAGLAGCAHRKYRKLGGGRDRVLADFLIGAHASTKGYRILTRDPRRYRTYFPALDIIAPDSHP